MNTRHKNARHKNEIVDELANGYEQMLERAVRDLGEAEHRTEDLLHSVVTAAQEKAVELGELTTQEAHHVAETLTRELNHLRRHIEHTGEGLKEWLGFEAALLEIGFLEALTKATNSDLVGQIARTGAEDPRPEYNTGDVCGPGTLACQKCGTTVQFLASNTVRSCEACGGDRFARQ